MWKRKKPSADTTISAGEDAKLEAYVGMKQEGVMSYSVKERVAECYRRAEEYKRLYHRASSLDERELYLATRRDFLRLAEDLEKTRSDPKAHRTE